MNSEKAPPASDAASPDYDALDTVDSERIVHSLEIADGAAHLDVKIDGDLMASTTNSW